MNFTSSSCVFRVPGEKCCFSCAHTVCNTYYVVHLHFFFAFFALPSLLTPGRCCSLDLIIMSCFWIMSQVINSYWSLNVHQNSNLINGCNPIIVINCLLNKEPMRNALYITPQWLFIDCSYNKFVMNCVFFSSPFLDHPKLYAQVPAQTTHSQSRWKQCVWIQEHCLLHSCLSWDSLHLCNLLSKPQGTVTINYVYYRL